MPTGHYVRTPEYRAMMKDVMKRAWASGRMTGRTGHTTSEETKRKMSASMTGKSSASWCLRGEKHPRWNGGTSESTRTGYYSHEYKKWRVAVFERDNYTCKWCKRKEEVTGKLNADHIKMRSLFPHLQFELSNGQTLCEPCHKWKTKMDLRLRYMALPELNPR